MLTILSEAFKEFCLLEVHKRVLIEKNDYSEAEALSDVVNATLSNRQTTPADFMISENDVIDDSIEIYNRYKKALDLYEMTTGEKRIELEHFCKALYYSGYRWMPEDYFSFNRQMNVTLKYIHNQITKNDYSRLMVDYDLNGPKPINLCRMRKRITIFESLLSSIIEKRYIRKRNRGENETVIVWL